jgi:broad specificity phosphatase PhoE
MRISSRFQIQAFSALNHRKLFPSTVSAGQAIAMQTRTMILKAAAVLAVAVFVGACGGSSQARSITLTFVRNAQSQANADGVIDTDVPGTGLSADGKTQAQQVLHSHNDFDAVYTSTMADAQQTAAPLASQLGKQSEIVAGLQAINAGWYNGKPESMANSTYMVAPSNWLTGDTRNSIPGSLSGADFNTQFATAIRKIYDSGHSKPVVFSQGEAIMVWTLMNVKNSKTGLLTSHPLPNIGRVVITGNPMDGWNLVEWDGLHNFN